MAEKDPAAVELGRRGGLKGGPARAAKMTAYQRSESARRAALARWGEFEGGEDSDAGKRIRRELAEIEAARHGLLLGE